MVNTGKEAARGLSVRRARADKNFFERVITSFPSWLSSPPSSPCPCRRPSSRPSSHPSSRRASRPSSRHASPPSSHHRLLSHRRRQRIVPHQEHYPPYGQQ